ncbi:MAG: hypothetical protein ABSG17_00700 [Spirochaetia bacterium]|jgi:hypothetical protein
MAKERATEPTSNFVAVEQLINKNRNTLANGDRVMRVSIQYDNGPGTPVFAENLIFLDGHWVVQ